MKKYSPRTSLILTCRWKAAAALTVITIGSRLFTKMGFNKHKCQSSSSHFIGYSPNEFLTKHADLGTYNKDEKQLYHCVNRPYPGLSPTQSPEKNRGQTGITALRQPTTSTRFLKLLKDTWKQQVDVFINPLRQFLFFIWAFLFPDAILSFGFKFKIALAGEKASPNATAHWTAEPRLCSMWFFAHDHHQKRCYKHVTIFIL